MNFTEALKKAKLGINVRKKCWPKDVWVGWKENEKSPWKGEYICHPSNVTPWGGFEPLASVDEECTIKDVWEADDWEEVDA